MFDTPEHADGWNFGPEERDAKPVRWIADKLVELWGEGLRWELEGLPQPHEAHYLKLDSSKARAHLGWYPRWDLERGLASTISWFRAYREQADMREVTLAQIREFERALAPPASASAPG